MSKKEKSVGWVIAASMILVAVFGWCALASMYADNAAANLPTRRLSARGAAAAGIIHMAINGITQIPNFFSVMAYGFSERLWLVITVAVIEGLLVVGGKKMKQLDEELSKERQRNRR